MNLAFKLHVVRKPDSGDSAVKFWPEPDAMTALDQFLRPHNISGSALFKSRTARNYTDLPWATLIWPHGVSLAGHLAELRHSRVDVTLSNPALWAGAPFDDSQLGNEMIIEFWRKPVLEDMAAQTPAFVPVWELLKDKPPTGFWLCLCDSPRGDWLEAAARDNIARYKKAEERKRQPSLFNPAVIPSPVAQLNYWTAQALTASKQFAQATELFAPLCKDFPRQHWLWKLHGDCLMSAYRAAEALPAFNEALTLVPNWRAAKVGLALAYKGTGDFKTARTLLDQVLIDDPHDLPALIQVLNLIEKQPPWEWEEELHIRLATRLSGLEPRVAMSWSRLGHAYTLGKKYDLAHPAFTKAIQLNPRSAIFWNNLGFVLAMSGQDLEAAENACLTALHLNPIIAGCWDTLGVIHLRQGFPKRALTEFQEAVALDPTLLDGWQNLARTYRRLGDQSGAITAWERIAELVIPDCLAVKARKAQESLGELFD
jgi:tetratricopeptide (TPR) repeat protein